MKHIKHTGSYISWIGYAALLGIGLLCFIATQCEVWGLSVYMAIPVFLGAVLICGGVTWLIYLADHSHLHTLFEHPIASKLFKTIGVVVFLTIGLYLRLQAIVSLGFENSFHENALQIFASQEGHVSHGITYFYLRLYLTAFRLFGAYAGTTILMEILLQLAFAFLLFFFLKKRIGYLGGLTAFGFLMCSPDVVSRMGTNSSEMLFLVFCISVCFLLYPAGEKTRGLFSFCMGGILIGILMFLDVSALLLYVLLVCGALKQSHSVGGCIFAGFIGGVMGTVGCMAIDAAQGGLSFASYFTDWIGNYYLGGILHISFTIEYLVITACLIVGVFGFYFVAKRDTYSIMVLLLLVLFAKEYVLISKQVTGSFLFYVLLICFAGISLQSCLEEQEEPEFQEEDDAEELISVSEIDKEKRRPRPEPPAREETKNEWVYGEPSDGRNVKYIENPLPPPKRHVRKTMDYPVSVTERNGEYDFVVSDDADYDI